MMRFELQCPSSLSVRLDVRQYDPELEDVRAVLSDVCRGIEHSGRFVVSGFGQEVWPVDVGTDLAVLLEQLPDVLPALACGMATEIDFYEQGIERTITLTPNGGGYLAACVSRTNWQPNPTVEEIDPLLLRLSFIELLDEFMRTIRIVAPELHEHPWMKSWLADCKS